MMRRLHSSVCPVGLLHPQRCASRAPRRVAISRNITLPDAKHCTTSGASGSGMSAASCGRQAVMRECVCVCVCTSSPLCRGWGWCVVPRTASTSSPCHMSNYPILLAVHARTTPPGLPRQVSDVARFRPNLARQTPPACLCVQNARKSPLAIIIEHVFRFRFRFRSALNRGCRNVKLGSRQP